MKELIELTNSENFSTQGFTYLKQLNFDAENSKVELRITLIDESEKENDWIINAENTVSFKNLDFGNLMPYLKINVYENHPLISLVQSPEIQCKLKGIPKNKFEFLGKFYQMIEKELGFWKNMHDFIWNTESLFVKKEIPENMKEFMTYEIETEYINLPKILVNPFSKLCEEENITLEIENEFSTEQTDIKILIFGNEIVSPDNFNLNQPYIIAENFYANKRNYS
ncbi:hypothetical protein [Chryseobacterium oryzae]|uniref:Uncharacterized protein n=1 Tax=Chryseobacterium oryzae TaxID=2929799 RepID=A0ABY4BJN0_9FLAO|nr:hypothetical protein [Chryseobacterium oryzae]UOE39393.1 hypothetical protein MTP08_06355 [Chryseobacterium oryzae]